MTRKEIVNKYANELYDSIDFIEYIQFKADYNKKDREFLLGEDRHLSNNEYLDLADEVNWEFINVVNQSSFLNIVQVDQLISMTGYYPSEVGLPFVILKRSRFGYS